MSTTQQSILSFIVGSPQSFIEPSRTLRDLWSGSYIVSWIASKSMSYVLEELRDASAFISPHLDEKSDLFAAVQGKPTRNKLSTLPSVPNKFAAIVPIVRAEELRAGTIEAANEAWNDIAKAVRTAIESKYFGSRSDWLDLWSQQIGSAIEFDAVAMPIENLAALKWNEIWEPLGALLEMTRSIKHVPPYLPDGDEFPPKCSLMGSYEQMGPANLKQSREFWESAAKNKGVEGTRLQSVDRLCAVSLVKRFAWPAFLSKQTKLPPRTLRYSDTATIAAKQWLDPLKWWIESEGNGGCESWNGQWLHWETSHQEEDDPCPDVLFDAIRSSRKSHGLPPIYYAILQLDGDNMGRLFATIDASNERGLEAVRSAQAKTKVLTEFGKHVYKIVEQHSGELIYCGGDDVLALVPVVEAVSCAHDLHLQFQALLGSEVSLSGGIAVVHYKEDLRYAIKVARKAEKDSKRIDCNKGHTPEKSAITIAVCRHSGEHSQFTMSWKTDRGFHTNNFNELVRRFQAGLSDRWVYRFRELLDDVIAIDADAVESELQRLLARIDLPETMSLAQVSDLILNQLWRPYLAEMTGQGRSWGLPKVCGHFATLLQSASFMARGRD